MKVLEVDAARKRIALSIKQTMEATARKTSFKNNRREPPKEKASSGNMNDALSLLKQKFGK